MRLATSSRAPTRSRCRGKQSRACLPSRAASEGRLAIGDVTLSAYVSLNYRVPLANGSGGSGPFKAVEEQQVCAFGSNHGSGANFTLADGSVRWIADSIPLATLRQLATRSGGEVVQDY